MKPKGIDDLEEMTPEEKAALEEERKRNLAQIDELRAAYVPPVINKSFPWPLVIGVSFVVLAAIGAVIYSVVK